MVMRVLRGIALLAALTAAGASVAEEGLWTFNNFPAARVRAATGFEPDAAWLDHLRQSTLRMASGCSASVISPTGLVMTNHHCARDCVENLSGLRHKDYNRDGFLAKQSTEEARCPGMELNRLDAITDVTAQIQQATSKVAADKFNEVQRATVASIEAACASSEALRCEVVNLFRGGRYELYTFRRFSDVRLVFAPEDQAANFGGDPDNFMFPRYALDVSFVRIYGDDGLPLKTDQHLRWSAQGARDGELSFVAGNPGGTSRSFTLAQIEADRDVNLPDSLIWMAELRGLLTQYQERGTEQRRHSNEWLLGIENSFKSLKGQHETLTDAGFMAQLQQRERDLREAVAARPALAAQVGPAWDRIAALTARSRQLHKESAALERGLQSQLFTLAQGLLRYGDEIGKPNGERLPEYADARLPEFRQQMLAQTPIHAELEQATLSWSLAKLREALGADHPLVKRIFGPRSAAEVARAAIKGSRLGELQADRQGRATGGLRKRLLDGGPAAIAASKDPMMMLARAIDADARAMRKRLETEIEGPLQQQQELLARARFAVYGDSAYPDATFTPRVTWGRVQGYQEHDRPVAPFTTFGGAFARHTGADPFALPKSWLKARTRLDLQMPLNFVTTNDIIGGNSGSPVVNQQGEWVGLIFDGNIQSLGGEYGFDAATNRAVAVHGPALIEALDKIYAARGLVDEIRGGVSR
jgi:hypothetical protein